MNSSTIFYITAVFTCVLSCVAHYYTQKNTEKEAKEAERKWKEAAVNMTTVVAQVITAQRGADRAAADLQARLAVLNAQLVAPGAAKADKGPLMKFDEVLAKNADIVAQDALAKADRDKQEAEDQKIAAEEAIELGRKIGPRFWRAIDVFKTVLEHSKGAPTPNLVKKVDFQMTRPPVTMTTYKDAMRSQAGQRYSPVHFSVEFEDGSSWAGTFVVGTRRSPKEIEKVPESYRAQHATIYPAISVAIKRPDRPQEHIGSVGFHPETAALMIQGRGYAEDSENARLPDDERIAAFVASMLVASRPSVQRP